MHPGGGSRNVDRMDGIGDRGLSYRCRYQRIATGAKRAPGIPGGTNHLIMVAGKLPHSPMSEARCSRQMLTPTLATMTAHHDQRGLH